jgi:hypothetical protein
MAEGIIRSIVMGGTLLLMAVTFGVSIWTGQLQHEINIGRYPSLLNQALLHPTAYSRPAITPPDSSQKR